MESVAARMAMVTDSPNPSLRSRTTVTTDGDSFVSTTSLPCCHFLSANVINVVKVWGKLSESLGKMCCVRPNIDHFTFIDENANLGPAMRYEEIELRILLLCGSDLLDSFCIPGLWKDSDMEVIVGDFGIVVVPRDGNDTEKIINQSSVLRRYKDNIIVVKDVTYHPLSIVSSTKSRLALQHGDGHVVDYLNQSVIDYILQTQLYITASG